MRFESVPFHWEGEAPAEPLLDGKHPRRLGRSLALPSTRGIELQNRIGRHVLSVSSSKPQFKRTEPRHPVLAPGSSNRGTPHRWSGRHQIAIRLRWPSEQEPLISSSPEPRLVSTALYGAFRSIQTSAVRDRTWDRASVVFQDQHWRYGKSGSTRRHWESELILAIQIEWTQSDRLLPNRHRIAEAPMPLGFQSSRSMVV